MEEVKEGSGSGRGSELGWKGVVKGAVSGEGVTGAGVAKKREKGWERE